ncbi:acyltransferase [Neobacillus sp. KR4-4]|uniref:acyltransferase n=1 Tax=Neobacillus sp. KR4-4 TaxID=3344872 RepID=UPI0035CA9293
MKIKKVFWVIERKLLHLLNYINPHSYMKLMNKYLKRIGINFPEGEAIYIDPSAQFDGIDYSLITIGKDTVISKEVLILTHDFSNLRAISSIGSRGKGKRILKPVEIGNNCFIGARTIILPGTKIGSNTIVGAGSVVKGNIPDGVVIVGNPAQIIKTTREYAEGYLKREGII